MTASRLAVRDQAPPRYPIDDFLADIGDVPATTEAVVVRRRSRDFFWYSPVLNAALNGKSADVVVSPRDEADVVRICAACLRHRIPLTVRAGGTGKYGQAVPLEGGVLLDVTGLSAIEWSRPGAVRVQAGARISDLDAALRPSGWEQRMHPSTKRTATVGGFVAGGSGGVGSVTYGGLRDPGNVLAARVVTMEEEPRILELRGAAAQAVNHAYGTTGVITALEMPLAPAWPWIDVVIAVDDFFAAVEIGQDLARADGIVKKLITPMMWPIPSYFGPARRHCPDGKAVIFAMIAEPSLEAARSIVGRRGEITYAEATDESPGHVPLYEYTWNHTTLQWLKQDRTITYLQCLLPADSIVAAQRRMWEMFPDEVYPHLEFMRFNGAVTCASLPIVRFTTEARLNEIIAAHEANGISIANPHVFTLEDGTRHMKADADQYGFKQQVDPYGLLNPGKMRSYVPVRT